MSDEILKCQKCGEIIREGAAFCIKCGTKLNSPDFSPKNGIAPQETPNKEKPRSLIKTIGIILILGFALIIMVGLLFGNSSSSLKQSDLSNEQIKHKSIVYSYDQLFKSPDNFKGNYVKQDGKVIQALYDGGSLTMRISTKMSDYGSYNEDVILVTYDGPMKISEGDEISVYGQYQGLNTYNTILGGKNTLPLIKAQIIESTKLVTKEDIQKSEAISYLVLNVDTLSDDSTKYTSKFVIRGTIKNNHPSKSLSSAKLIGYFADKNKVEIDSVSHYINDLKPGQIREYEITSYKDSNKMSQGWVEIGSSRFE